MNTYKDRKAKLESAYSFMLKYPKITVWPETAKSVYFACHEKLFNKLAWFFYSLATCNNSTKGSSKMSMKLQK